MPHNIALLGCGAIAHEIYLPALAKRREVFDSLWLVDPDKSTLEQACSVLSAKSAPSLADISDELQFVIIASPSGLHFSMAKEALLRGAHTLIEKPFVVWPEEGRELLALSRSKDRIVAVNQPRRLFPNTIEIRDRIARGDFGALRYVKHSEGNKLTWPFRSGATFASTAQRVGVIMDIGVHVLDMYQSLFNPKWTFERAIHDGFNGPEGLAEIALTANGAPVSVKLSRYQRQENIARLIFDDCEVAIAAHDTMRYLERRGKRSVHRRAALTKGASAMSVGEAILDNFIGAGEGRGEAFCCAAKSLPVIELLDEIYQRATHFPTALGTV